jgi:hypothetical protein
MLRRHRAALAWWLRTHRYLLKRIAVTTGVGLVGALVTVGLIGFAQDYDMGFMGFLFVPVWAAGVFFVWVVTGVDGDG